MATTLNVREQPSFIESAPTTARPDLWLPAVRETLRAGGAHGPDPGDPDAAMPSPGVRLITRHAGAVHVTEVSDAPDPMSAPGASASAPRRVRGDDLALCEVVTPVDGFIVVDQGGGQARLEPGDITFVDPSRVSHWVVSARRVILVHFPAALLPRHLVTALLRVDRIRGDSGAGALVSLLTRHLPRHLDDCAPAAGTSLGVAVLDLLVATLDARVEPAATPLSPRSRQQALLRRIHAFIEAHLDDPELSPARIAAAHHVSLRYLHKLFHGEGHGVAAWIRCRRLERCRRDLVDPTQRARPVSAIAARWGLPDPAHFSRVFKVAYGLAPAEYRLAGTRVGSR